MTEVYLPNDATAISGAETSDLRGKAKTRRRKEKEERVTNGSRVRSSRNIRSRCIRAEIILFVAQLPRVPLLDFLGCTYFMSAPICFEGRVLLVAREKSFAARSYGVNTSHLEGFKES